MRSILFSIIAFAVFTVSAQDIETIKQLTVLQKYKDAKVQIDKALQSEKTAKKAEPWMLKSTIYSALAADNSISKDEAATLQTEAANALKKYMELDATNNLFTDPIYAGTAGSIYGNYYNVGIKHFNAKEWEQAYEGFKNASEISDILIKHKIASMSLDTNALLLAGASAQNAKKDDQAAAMFTRLSDAKITGADNEFVYQFLVNYYMNKKDEANFKKYVQVGKELYPKSKYFPGVEFEYVRNNGDFNKLVEYYESKIAAEPNNYDFSYDLGTEIYDHLYPKDTAKSPKGDLSGLETKMIQTFEKAATLKESAGMPYAIIGNHFIKKSEMVNDAIRGIGDQIRALNKNAKPDKNGKLPPAPKELLAKRDELYKQYDALIDQSATYFEKAADRFSKNGQLDNLEKSFYRNSVNNLIEIYGLKKSNAKGNAAEVTKYTAAEKKWKDAYSHLQ